MKQFEQLHPLAQEAIQYLKKHFENLVFKDLSNVLYEKYDNNFYPYGIFNDALTKQKYADNKLKSEFLQQIARHYMYFNYYLNIEFDQIYNDCLFFLNLKNFFIKIPIKLKKYDLGDVCLNLNCYVADNS